MVEGLWTIEFISSLKFYGTGILVLHNSRLLGGDDAYYYDGSYSVHNSNINGRVDVTRYKRGGISVFGDFDHFSMTFEGRVMEGNHIDGVANVTGREGVGIKIICKKKVDL